MSSTLSLFPVAAPAMEGVVPVAGPDAVDYFPTAGWFAAAMVSRYLEDVGRDACVCDPAAGDGAFLRELDRQHFPKAYGIELDAKLAEHARRTSGRDVVVGDALRVSFPAVPTHVITSPPFSVAWISAFLGRMNAVMDDGGKIIFLLPAYALQTSARVAEYHRTYSIAVDAIPRDIFPGFDKPLCVATFTKERVRRLVGLAFYVETADLRNFPTRFQALLRRSTTNVWTAACLEALRTLGGRGSVGQIARVIAGARPTPTAHWREAIRKHLRQHFERVAPGVYEIPRALLVPA